MLHPDSHNMFENGSYLRRRRRFKQELSNHHHQEQQQRHHRNPQGSRQKEHQNSPNFISPNSLTDARHPTTKLSRSRDQLDKDTTSNDTDCLESPKKVF